MGTIHRVSPPAQRRATDSPTPGTSSGVQAPICPRIDFNALLSIWRMRSADTPYSSARSCSVAASSSRSHRASMIRRLRSSRRARRLAEPGGSVPAGLGAFEDPRRVVLGVGQVGNGRDGVAVIPRLRVHRDVLAGKTRLHFDHFFRLDAELFGDRLHLGRRQRVGAGLHAAQVEEQLALRLRRGDLDEPPVAQDELVDLRPDPMQRKADETHATLRVEAAHGLHQPDVAFLDEIRLRQAVARVFAADRDHQPQVRQHKLRAPRRCRRAAAAAGRARSPAPPSTAESGSPPGCSDPGFPATPGWGTPMPIQSCCLLVWANRRVRVSADPHRPPDLILALRQ